MRDTAIARRRLLALALGIAADAALPAAARSRERHRTARVTPRVIVIDPGHGGVDPGAISPHGIYEKDITLATARELVRALRTTGRCHPVLTRDRDIYVSLRARVARAHAIKAALFLSVHADALPDPELRGLSVYTLSERASDRQSAALATRENRDDFVAGVHLRNEPRDIRGVLFDLARRETENESLALAGAIVSELGRRVPLLENPHRAAGFVVLTATDIPSALVELGCLSNPTDERLLPQPAYQRRIAQGLVRAIEDCLAAL